jgi:hypothetical protein
MEITGDDAAAACVADTAARPGSCVTKPFDPPVLASLLAGELGCAGELEQAPATLPAPVAHGHPAA